MLVTKSFEDPPTGMELLLVHFLVDLDDLVDDRDHRSELRFHARPSSPIAGRLFMAEDFLNRPKIQVVLLASVPPAHLAGNHSPTNVSP